LLQAVSSSLEADSSEFEFDQKKSAKADWAELSFRHTRRSSTMDRRERTFPICFEDIKPTRFTKGGQKMYYAHEWAAYRKSLHRDEPIAKPLAASQMPADVAVNVTPNVIDKAPIQNVPAAAAPAPSKITAEPLPSAPEPIRPTSASTTTPISPAPSSTSSISLTSSTSSISPIRPPDFSRHARRCCICLHPHRDAIEGDFIRWRSPELIAQDYKIASRNSIYRHAHCVGLYSWRRQELGRVLEGILESAEHIPLELSDVVIRAARIYAHLDERGNLFEPPRTNFILTGAAPALYPLESAMPTNSARSKPRHKKRARATAGSNRYIRQFRKKVK
jgi:hypothetical protein